MPTQSPFGEEFTKLTELVNSLGFDGVLYSFYPKPMYMNSEVQPVLHFSENFTGFVGHYLKNDYGNCDFVLRLALKGRREPIDWWEEIRVGHISPAEQVVTRDAKEKFGINHGLSIPVLYGTFAIAGISVILKQDNLEHFEELKRTTVVTLHTAARQYHTKIVRSREELRFFIHPMLDSLTDTKKKVLKHLMSGQPMKTIPRTKGVTQRYAEKTLLELRQEFGDISTNELMYILGMVNMDEYL